jgi:hypothetical protein
MKKWILRFFPAFLASAGLLLPVVFGGPTDRQERETRPSPPDQETRRDQTDYMRSLLERNPQLPLGLQDNPELKLRLRQSGIRWAVRSARRHILD